MNTGIRFARPTLRVCKTLDHKRTVAAWMLYDDVNAKFPPDATFESPYTPSPPPYEICEIEGKGRGMVASRQIKNGELIVCERPVLLAPIVQIQEGDPKDRWRAMTKHLLRLLYCLEQEDREKVLQLVNSKPLEEYGPLAGVFLTNSLSAEFPWSEICRSYGAMCLRISYANHSCDQNAHYYFDEASMTFSLRAIRDIDKGEEITISYIESDLPRAQRQQQLRARYDFTCTCSRCSAPLRASVASDRRRQFIFDALNTLDDMAKRWTTCNPEEREALKKRDLGTVHALLQAIDEEKLQTRRIEPLRQLAFMYAILGDSERFKETARECLKALELTKEWNDEDAKWYAKWQEWIEKPESFPVWGRWG